MAPEDHIGEDLLAFLIYVKLSVNGARVFKLCVRVARFRAMRRNAVPIHWHSASAAPISAVLRLVWFNFGAAAASISDPFATTFVTPASTLRPLASRF